MSATIPLVDFSWDSSQEFDASLTDGFESHGLGKYLFKDVVGMSFFPSPPMDDPSSLDFPSQLLDSRGDGVHESI